ncbi:hypothetical protein V6R21_19110 [Limibacter armeniacum]|uniref:hypothetical protein n=1 Tax=Limibacter armeniacum TaxID=466084 RepID=UPI002FE64D55
MKGNVQELEILVDGESRGTIGEFSYLQVQVKSNQGFVNLEIKGEESTFYTFTPVEGALNFLKCKTSKNNPKPKVEQLEEELAMVDIKYIKHVQKKKKVQ